MNFWSQMHYDEWNFSLFIMMPFWKTHTPTRIFLLSIIVWSLCLQGKVNLRKPEHNFWLIEIDNCEGNNGLPPVEQKRIFFGREVGAADRKLLPTYELKSRNYLGPTAMDAEIAFLMANQALATPGKLVYDPFVGTGSILVAAAHFGAMTMVCFSFFVLLFFFSLFLSNLSFHNLLQWILFRKVHIDMHVDYFL